MLRRSFFQAAAGLAGALFAGWVSRRHRVGPRRAEADDLTWPAEVQWPEGPKPFLIPPANQPVIMPQYGHIKAPIVCGHKVILPKGDEERLIHPGDTITIKASLERNTPFFAPIPGRLLVNGKLAS